jgi:hypothetical protein
MEEIICSDGKQWHMNLLLGIFKLKMSANSIAYDKQYSAYYQRKTVHAQCPVLLKN